MSISKRIYEPPCRSSPKLTFFSIKLLFLKFNEAKKIGVDYVISKYNLQNKDLVLIKKITKDLHLLKIL